MSLRLMIRGILGRSVYLGELEVKIYRMEAGCSPSVLIMAENCKQDRPANKEELEAFAKKYKPSWWYPDIFGIEKGTSGPTPFGRIVEVYHIKGKRVERVPYNPIWGLPRNSLVLFVLAA